LALTTTYQNNKAIIKLGSSMTRSQAPSWTQVGSKLLTQWNCEELGTRSQLLALEGVEGRVEAPEWD